MHVSIRISCCLSVCICIDTTMRNIRQEPTEVTTRAALYFCRGYHRHHRYPRCRLYHRYHRYRRYRLYHR